jgi:hypothetical protein
MADPGAALSVPDLQATPTALLAYELPWDGMGGAETRTPFAAASATSAGWRGAALYVEQGTALVSIGSSGRRRSVIGTTATTLAPSAGLLLDRNDRLEVALLSTDFILDPTDLAEIAGGATMVLVGDEVLQFLDAEQISDARWRLTGLLRGRGGTEPMARQGAPAGAAFVLLDDAPIALDPAKVGEGTTIAAIGLADPEPVYAPLQNAGISQRPLMPVHGRALMRIDGSLRLEWCRRSRGSWLWLDGVDVPLNEQTEAYVVGIGVVGIPDLQWEKTSPLLEEDETIGSSIRSAQAGSLLWGQLVGTAARSPPLLLMTIA